MLDEQQVYDALLELNRARLISYIPRSRTPYIYFSHRTRRAPICDHRKEHI